MGIKLLEKSKIADLKAKEQAREVREGIKIASRIDNLRELWSKTEQDYEIWKTNTIAEVNSEIMAHLARKEHLIVEIRELEAKKEALEIELLDKEHGIPD